MDQVPIESLPTLKIEESDVRPQIDRKRRERAIQIGSAIISVLLLFFLIVSLYPDFPYFYHYSLRPTAVRYWPNLAAVIILLVIGFNLYVFRGYKPFWFGVAEIVFACGLGWYAMNKAMAGSVPDAVVILFAALYIMGRGWINVSTEARPLRIESKEMRK